MVKCGRSLKVLGAASLGLAMAFLPVGSAEGSARGGKRTIVITGTQHDHLSTVGCMSPVGFCAEGNFKGKTQHGKRVTGVDHFTALAFNPIPGDPLGRQSVPGVSTYTTKKGELTISDVSVNDPVRGTFAGVGRIVGATGEFAGATGDDWTYGRSNPDGSLDTKFVIEYTLP